MGYNEFDILKTIYETAIGDIKFIKEQQWKITNYGLLAIVSIYSTLILINENVLRECKWFTFSIVCILILFIIVLCRWLLKQSISDIEISRQRIERCKEAFGEFYLKILQPEKIEVKMAFSKKLIFMFYAILIFAAVIVTFISAMKIFPI